MSRFQDFLETITWWDDREPGELSAAERAAIAEEAAYWFVTLEEAGRRERAEFLKWARRSPHHLTAYFDTVRIDAQLKATIGAVPIVASEPPDVWGNLAKHPLAIIAAAVLATGGTVWAVSDNVRVRPAAQHIEELERRVAELQSRLPASQEPSKAATAGSQRSEGSPPKPRGP